MPKKSKKQKLSHHTHDHALSHHEIWDDSALIDSWNAAVAEYDHYHSLHAQGIDVDKVLDGAEAAEQRGGEVDLVLSPGDEGKNGGDCGERGDVGGGFDEIEEGEVEEGEVEDEVPGRARQVNANSTRKENGRQMGPQLPTSTNPQHPTAANGGTGPLAPAPDQTLENIKMAYYWAGYYSGLHDGQRQAAEQPHGNADATQ